MAELWALFVVFFKIGLFSFGGGYAILPLIQKEVVESHKWISVTQFTDIVAVSQVTPGPIAINSSTYVGYLVTGNVVGATVATVGLVLPSVIVMTLFSIFFLKFTGLRVVVVGLILSATILLMDKDNFIDYKSFIIFAVALVLFLKWKVNAIWLTIGAAIIGILIY
mgnify:CR=1 FL=1